MKLESLVLHHGYTSEATTKSAAVPIYQTTSYTFDDTQHGADLFDLKVACNIYSRIMNPTNAVLEARLAEIEGGIGALALASGMAAITYALQALTQVGDNIAKRLNFDYTIWTENKLSVSQPISLFLLFACAHLCSIGLRSGEYVGKYSTIYPASMMTC